MQQDKKIVRTKAGINRNVPCGSFINPEMIVSQLGFATGMKVADFGCGTGYFAFPIAKKIGNEGVVYALDIVREKLETVESEAKVLGLSNILVKRSNLEQRTGSGLDRESIDWVILVDMIFQNKYKKEILQEAKRVLKKGGHALLIEWNEKNLAIGPERKMRVAKDDLVKLANESGLGIEKELEVSNFHYGLILIKYK